jgi:hypothetical protein
LSPENLGSESADVSNKRCHMDITASLGSTPQKKKSQIKSAITTALKRSPKGLTIFFKKCICEEWEAQAKRAGEDENGRWEGRKEKEISRKAERAKRTQEMDCKQQHQHQEKVHDNEVTSGV